MAQSAEDKRKHVKARREARIAEGVCTSCGERRPLPGCRKCNLCRDKDTNGPLNVLDETSIQDHPMWAETLRKVVTFILDSDARGDKGVTFGRIYRGVNCPPDLISAALSWLQIESDKENLPVLFALHKAPERYSFAIDGRNLRVIPKSEFHKYSPIPAPSRHIDSRTYFRLTK